MNKYSGTDVMPGPSLSTSILMYKQRQSVEVLSGHPKTELLGFKPSPVSTQQNPSQPGPCLRHHDTLMETLVPVQRYTPTIDGLLRTNSLF